MDCAVCYKTVNSLMESDPRPYVHCIQKPRLNEVFMVSCPVLSSLLCVVGKFMSRRIMLLSFVFVHTMY